MLVSLQSPELRPGDVRRVALLQDERRFYARHDWSINPHLTVADAAMHLRAELDELMHWPEAWQRREAAVNVWLLASGILSAADDRLRGKTLRVATLRRVTEQAERLARWADFPARAALRAWRTAWLAGLEAILPPLLGEAMPADIPQVLRRPIPDSLAGETLAVPSPFQRLDLTHADVLALGRALMQHIPDRDTPLALIGLRTSGSYFAPLIKLQLQREGYRSLAFATLDPKKGPDADERKAMRTLAADGCTAVLVDDPPHSGSTLQAAIGFAQQAGFRRDALHVLVPTHPAKPDWAANFPDGMAIALAPKHWHKVALMQAQRLETQLADYLGPCKLVESERAERYTKQLRSCSSDVRVPRLKRVYEVEMQSGRGRETLFVLAKSVGSGWYSYPAYLAAERLSAHVPSLLGLRDGILYTQYLPQAGETVRPSPEAAADYVAARVRAFSFPAGAKFKSRNGGLRLLVNVLSGAYGRPFISAAMRADIAVRLGRLPCPAAAWIDGNMQRGEWIAGPNGVLKTDFEHHGLGKAALNVADPAFDLADAIVHGEFSADEERALVARYVQQSGDAGVGQRLFVAKLLAGICSMNEAQQQVLGPARDTASLARANARFLRAWHFLTAETARFAGRHLPHAQMRAWCAPLVFLDVDGVIDRRLFGFPATTAAGVQALAALSRRSVVLNTARSIAEVKTYCEAYGLCGGVAEYGSYMWNALRGEGRVLVSDESLKQLEALRAALKSIPGVFLDDAYTCSIRAFGYRSKSEGLLAALSSARRADIGDGAVEPLSLVLVKQLIADLGLDRLRVHPTSIDTTIVAREVDKGTGLSAFRDWVFGPDAETIAVGDSDADLPMFKAATRSFAPANIGCRHAARLLGCEIVGESYQRGLLEIARRIGGGGTTALASPEMTEHDALLAKIFEVADLPLFKRVLRALSNPSGLSILLR
jgi:hydroxymethylpyrimidine pyrophosphatase-like HAD family hydrolase